METKETTFNAKKTTNVLMVKLEAQKRSFLSKYFENFRKNKNLSYDDEFNVKSQKKDRNVTSNLIHHLLKNLVNSKETKQSVENITSQRNF